MAAAAEMSDAQKSLYSVRRPQYLSDRTMVGTSLEINDGCSPELELKEHERTRILNTPLGTALNPEREEVARKKQILRQTQKDLDYLKIKAVNFLPELRTIVKESRAGPHSSHVDKSHQWFKRKHLDHSDEINIVGLSKYGSYNRDKYGHHLRGNTEVGSLLKSRINYTSYPDSNYNINANFESYDVFGSGEDKSQYKSAIELPSNVRHQFGSRVCDDVLVDKLKVENNVVKLPALRLRKLRVPEIPLPRGTNQTYINISNYQRQNVLPGCPLIYTKGVNRTVHNDSVFKRRYPDPDQFRYQKDSETRWAELHLVEIAVQKELRRARGLEGKK